MKVDYIVVHYSATYTHVRTPIEVIKQWHKRRGFRTIGYHYYITVDGTIWEGRPENEMGAHVLGYNDRSLGVCYEGGLEKATGDNVGVDTRTPEQTASLIALIRRMKARHLEAEVVGHKDLANTQCPGFDVPAWWATVNAPVYENFFERLLYALFPMLRGAK